MLKTYKETQPEVYKTLQAERVSKLSKLNITVCASKVHECPLRTNTDLIFPSPNFEIEADRNYLNTRFGDHNYYFSFFSNEAIIATVTVTFGRKAASSYNVLRNYQPETLMDKLKNIDFKKCFGFTKEDI